VTIRFTLKKCHKCCDKYFSEIIMSQNPSIMKKDNSLRSLLGISQKDLAVILGVTRSQVAMFETGKRDLPLKAKQTLTELIAYLKEKKEPTSREPDGKMQVLMIKEIEKMLKENERKQILLERKLKALHKKILRQYNFVKAAGFMNGRINKNEKVNQAREEVTSEILKLNDTNFILEFDQELLIAKHKFLSEQLQQMKSAL